MKRRAIVSVNDKRGIISVAQALVAAGYEIVSTGGTAAALTGNGLPITPVEEVTGFPECMDGRVKTLHPRIFAGILAVRDNPGHVDTLLEHGIATVDIIVSNLYPFRDTVATPNCTLEEAIERIDIGGPSMIRAAAKNYKHVTVVTDPMQYDEFISRLREETLDEPYRFRLAAQVFALMAEYDAAVARYLSERL